MAILTRANLIWLAVYAILMSGLVGSSLQVRQWALETYSQPAEQVAWQQWGEAAYRQAAGEGPVSRRAVKSGEPPVLVLMRDHFTTCLLAVLTLSTALFGTLMVMLRGIFSGPPTLTQQPEPGP